MLSSKADTYLTTVNDWVFVDPPGYVCNSGVNELRYFNPDTRLLHRGQFNMSSDPQIILSPFFNQSIISCCRFCPISFVAVHTCQYSLSLL
jgi:hypothetical protein